MVTLNESLRRQILRRGGAILTEYPLGERPLKTNFRPRNRLISGMSVGTCVVEAPQRSGALITAQAALDQGRDVFVVPGNIDVPTCEGSNALLREGAISVMSGWDVVSEYAHLYPDRVRKDTAPSMQTVTAAELEEAQNHLPKVAQKPRLPISKGLSDKKKEKKPELRILR